MFLTLRYVSMFSQDGVDLSDVVESFRTVPVTRGAALSSRN